MFEFMYIRSSHEKLLYQMLFDIENRCSAKQMFSFSNTAVRLQLY